MVCDEYEVLEEIQPQDLDGCMLVVMAEASSTFPLSYLAKHDNKDLKTAINTSPF